MMNKPKRIPRKKIQTKITHWGRGCSDRMCGAEDCSTCYPFHWDESQNNMPPHHEYGDEYGNDFTDS
tara:strand:+ start:316 stop:516 length:201 start_codon:yes stop_codon:yes gene_type:complete